MDTKALVTAAKMFKKFAEEKDSLFEGAEAADDIIDVPADVPLEVDEQAGDEPKNYVEEIYDKIWERANAEEDSFHYILEDLPEDSESPDELLRFLDVIGLDSDQLESVHKALTGENVQSYISKMVVDWICEKLNVPTLSEIMQMNEFRKNPLQNYEEPEINRLTGRHSIGKNRGPYYDLARAKELKAKWQKDYPHLTDGLVDSSDEDALE